MSYDPWAKSKKSWLIIKSCMLPHQNVKDELKDQHPDAKTAFDTKVAKGSSLFNWGISGEPLQLIVNERVHISSNYVSTYMAWYRQ